MDRALHRRALVRSSTVSSLWIQQRQNSSLFDVSEESINIDPLNVSLPPSPLPPSDVLAPPPAPEECCLPSHLRLLSGERGPRFIRSLDVSKQTLIFPSCTDPPTQLHESAHARYLTRSTAEQLRLDECGGHHHCGRSAGWNPNCAKSDLSISTSQLIRCDQGLVFLIILFRPSHTESRRSVLLLESSFAICLILMLVALLLSTVSLLSPSLSLSFPDCLWCARSSLRPSQPFSPRQVSLLPRS